MEKEIVVLSLDFIFGPISKDFTDSEGNEITNIKVIDENKEIQALDNKINELWSSLWIKNDSSLCGYYFNNEREKKLAPELLKMVSELIKKLNEINDGSYELQDMISEHL